jgi:hypothetical protein
LFPTLEGTIEREGKKEKVKEERGKRKEERGKRKEESWTNFDQERRGSCLYFLL